MQTESTLPFGITPAQIAYVREHWGKEPLTHIQKSAGLSYQAFLYSAYGVLQLKPYTSKPHGRPRIYKDLADYTGMRLHQHRGGKGSTSAFLPRIVTEATGYDAGEVVPVRAYKTLNKVVLELSVKRT